MPPRIRLQPRHLRVRVYNHHARLQQCNYASLATATTPAAPIEQMTQSAAPIRLFPKTQPPSHKPPEFRKSQLHRQYASLIQSSPLILLFQHNNLRAVEWSGIRRELANALRKVDAEFGNGNPDNIISHGIKLQILQTGILPHVFRVLEFFDPSQQPQAEAHHPTDPATQTSAQVPNTLPTPNDPRYTHLLSRAAHEAARNTKKRLDFEVLLSGPIAALSFPAVSPQHLKAALSILAPSPDFPAPKRKVNPEYHSPIVQSGLQKLMMLGARVEGKTFDQDGTRWVGGIDGGLDGLRAQLVYMLQGAGAGVTNALEGASRSLWFTMENRKAMLEEEAKPAEEKPKEEGQ